MSDDHPLLTKRMGGAVTIMGFTTGLGLVLMSYQLFWEGMLLSLAGAGGAVWIYWSDLHQLRLRLVNQNSGMATPLFPELWLILVAILIAIGTPAFIYIRASLPKFPSDLSRHLEEDQKIRLRAALRLPANLAYGLEFNSVPNCDECENYAQEFRDFVGSIPGWKAWGGVIIFGGDMGFRYGLKFYPTIDASPEYVKTINNAFSGASIPLASGSPGGRIQDLGAEGIIVVNRRPK